MVAIKTIQHLLTGIGAKESIIRGIKYPINSCCKISGVKRDFTKWTSDGIIIADFGLYQHMTVYAFIQKSTVKAVSRTGGTALNV